MKIKELTFNRNGLFCPISFTVVYDDGTSEILLPLKPKNKNKGWTIEELQLFIDGVLKKYEASTLIKLEKDKKGNLQYRTKQI